jgi:flagellar biosynthesis anti-sigma factor FlgM
MISRSELHGAVQAYLRGLAGSGAPAAASPRAADGVQISAAPSDIARWRQILHSLPDVDTARVAALAQQVADGSYRPSADAVASQILARWLGDRLAR